MFRITLFFVGAAMFLPFGFSSQSEAQQVIRVRKPDGSRYEDPRAPALEADIQRWQAFGKELDARFAKIQAMKKSLIEEGRQVDTYQLFQGTPRKTPEGVARYRRALAQYNDRVDACNRYVRNYNQDVQDYNRRRLQLLNRLKQLEN